MFSQEERCIIMYNACLRLVTFVMLKIIHRTGKNTVL